MYSAHRAQFCDFYVSQEKNKRRLLPYTTLNDWFF
jgi:hypothetical protein